jgi:hypothetical protein
MEGGEPGYFRGKIVNPESSSGVRLGGGCGAMDGPDLASGLPDWWMPHEDGSTVNRKPGSVHDPALNTPAEAHAYDHVLHEFARLESDKVFARHGQSGGDDAHSYVARSDGVMGETAVLAAYFIVLEAGPQPFLTGGLPGVADGASPRL